MRKAVGFPKPAVGSTVFSTRGQPMLRTAVISPVAVLAWLIHRGKRQQADTLLMQRGPARRPERGSS
jgi:hypothetical protein